MKVKDDFMSDDAAEKLLVEALAMLIENPNEFSVSDDGDVHWVGEDAPDSYDYDDNEDDIPIGMAAEDSEPYGNEE